MMRCIHVHVCVEGMGMGLLELLLTAWLYDMLYVYVCHWVILERVYTVFFDENRVTFTIASAPHAEASQKFSA